MTFKRMDESKLEDWQTIGKEHMPYQVALPERVMGMLRQLESFSGGFGVDQLHHALQTATMAKRAGASKELQLCALVHDIGKVVSVANHPAIAAEIIKPYVSEEAYQIVRTHQDFQGRHYYALLGKDPEAREQYRDEPWFAAAERFTDEWDQAAFDPEYELIPLEEWRPLVEEILGTFKL